MPTRESTVPTQSGSIVEKREGKEFVVIDGIRFQKSIPESLIESILGKMKEADERLLRPESMRKDRLSLFEHFLMGGTATVIRDPLTPFGLYTKSKSLNEIRQGRANESRWLVVGLKADTVNDTKLDMDESTRRVFDEFVTSKGWDTYRAELEDIELNTETGKVEMPKIKSVTDPGENVLPPGCEGKIRLAEYSTSPTQHQLFDDNAPIIGYIDKDGWRFELK